MKDFDNDVREIDNDNSDNLNNTDINGDLKKEENNAQTFKDNQESQKTTEEGLEGKEENNAAQEGADDKKESDNGGQGEAPQGEVHTEEPIRQQYSSCYTPPYYVPNFTVVDGDNKDEAEKLKKKKRNAWRMVIVTGAILAVLLVIFAIA